MTGSKTGDIERRKVERKRREDREGEEDDKVRKGKRRIGEKERKINTENSFILVSSSVFKNEVLCRIQSNTGKISLQFNE
jgi:hypothetical protein